MADNSHRGSKAPGLGAPTGTRQLTDLLLENMSQGLLGPGVTRFLSDSLRTIVNQSGRPGMPWPMLVGTVVHALPHLNWYKVQLGQGGGFTGATTLDNACRLPVGVRDVGMVPPGSQVLLVRPPGSRTALILGAVPPVVRWGKLNVPDRVQQGGGTGYRVEEAHRRPLGTMPGAGGAVDFSAGAPVDMTAFDRGLLSETGLGLVVGLFQAQLRVNEACGLFLNYLDGGHARLSGPQLDVWSAAHEETYRNDEGECHDVRGRTVYPWEGQGRYAPGEEQGARTDPLTVQTTEAVADLDLAGADRRTQPFSRRRDYGGYLGQGGVREVVAPPRASGPRRADDVEDDVCLFRESIGLEGAYSIEAAKEIFIVKRGKMPAARQRRAPEDPLGDDARRGGYRPSGRFGSGPEHRVSGGVAVTGAGASIPRGNALAAQVEQVLAHQLNWKALHPFHYHAADWALPQESAAPGGSRVQDVLDFGTLQGQTYMTSPTPIRLRIDHRYNDVEYYQRMSFLAFLDDGGVALGCGYGGQLAFAGGHAYLDVPGDIVLRPARRLVGKCGEAIISAEKAIDLSASDGDARLYGHRNTQVAGGGVLIHGLRPGGHDYENKIGEDVQSTGVVVKSHGDLALLGRDVYVRSGAIPNGGGGQLVLDANERRGSLVLNCRDANLFTATAVSFWVAAEDQPPAHVGAFGPGGALFTGGLIVRGRAVFTGESGLIVGGNVAVKGGISADGNIGSRDGGFLGKLSPLAQDQIREALDETAEGVQEYLDAGAELPERMIDEPWYAEMRPGNERFREIAGFSYRDDDASRQYATGAAYRMAETRWQRLARLGGGSGGRAWRENPVEYQGRLLYPFPGREAWNGATYVTGGGGLYLEGAGVAADRPGPYEDPEVTTGLTSPAAGLTIIV